MGYAVNDKVLFSYADFDGSGVLTGIITEVHQDHAVAICDGMTLWIDADNADMFRRDNT